MIPTWWENRKNDEGKDEQYWPEGANHHRDSQIMKHNNGFTFSQGNVDAGRIGGELNMDEDPRKNFWEDGNGSGTEKADAYQHLSWNSKNADEFHWKSRQPFIKNYNFGDREPTHHNNGVTLQL